MNAQKRILDAKSSHLFAWSFKFDNCDDDFEIESIDKKLLSFGWERKIFSSNDKSEISKTDFMLKQYLSTSAKDVFTNENSQICKVYTYPDGLQDYKYIIENYYFNYEKMQGNFKTFELPIACVELHVYNYGVGVLWIQLYNTEYTEISDIKLINDLGRRITLPFIPDEAKIHKNEINNEEIEEKGIIICAERLGFLSKNEQKKSYIVEYRKLCEELKDNPQNINELEQPASFLFDLLNCNIGRQNTSEKNSLSRYNIRSFADDRMFTFCVIRNNELSNRIKDIDLSNFELVDTLYQIAYVDPNSNSCPNQNMQIELLERALYPRWSAWGTVHLITDYSMFCITGEESFINNSVVKPFLVEYAYCISLVLAQRMGISEFSVKAGSVVHGVEKKGSISRKKVKILINLQEQYITFKNQLLILEFTSQEQGIELYSLLQQQLFIQKEQSILDEQLESLYEVTNVSNGNLLNKLAIWLAVAAIIVDVIVNLICGFFF